MVEFRIISLNMMFVKVSDDSTDDSDGDSYVDSDDVKSILDGEDDDLNLATESLGDSGDTIKGEPSLADKMESAHERARKRRELQGMRDVDRTPRKSKRRQGKAAGKSKRGKGKKKSIRNY
jgi:hypothetical protein